MKTAIMISMALALFVVAVVPTSAQIAPSPVVGPSPSAGPWIVGGIGFGVLSVMVRAKVVGDRERRELTSDEATQAFFLPFLWIIFSPRAINPIVDRPESLGGYANEILEEPPLWQFNPNDPTVKSTVRRGRKAGIK